MEAFYFGASENYLYGVYHPPTINKMRDEAVLICSPFGQEYMRSHRSLKQLAVGLSKLGYHVLRFDYRGQGDSAGDLEGVTPQQWQEDILSACQELLDVSMAKKISIVGLRLGALLAASLPEKPKSLRRMVVWDPVVGGQEYLNEIKPGAKQVNGDNSLSINGFIMPATFQDALKSLSLNSSLSQFSGAFHHVVSHENETVLRLKDGWSKFDNYRYTLCPSPHDWNYVDSVGGLLWPVAMIQKIITLFDGD